MAVDRKPSYRNTLSKLLASQRLSPGERVVFQKLAQALSSGQPLTEREQDWVESVRQRVELSS